MKKRILSLVLAFWMVLSIIPVQTIAESGTPGTDASNPGTTVEIQPDNCPYCADSTDDEGNVVHGIECTAAYVYDGTADTGRYVRFIEAAKTFAVADGSDISEAGAFLFDYVDFTADTILRITDWYWDSKTTGIWYQVVFYSGAVVEEYAQDWPEDAWVLHDYSDTSYEFGSSFEFLSICNVCGKPDCSAEHVICDLCGDYDCTALHFYCETCEEYNCDEDHLYCNVCQIYDCGKTHTWCGYCGTYECGKTHESLPSPDTDPVIPENPTLTEGADVSIVDGNGDPVTDDGFRIEAGQKASLSAWLQQEENVAYRWQICYDLANDLWTEIRGQDEQGILLSPVMVQSMIKYQGRALIRCVVIDANGIRTSEAIPVRVASQAYSQASSSSIVPQEEGGGELQKAYVVVQYVYSDGRTAAATEFAEIIPGTAYSHDYALPKIPGYKATLNSHSFGSSVAISGDKLSMNFAAGELKDEYTIFTVTYEPDYVSYTVIHYWQNVDNDNYTEHERETVTTTHKTGDVISDAHKSYPGFYNLLYETPAAAADGSTVIEVYYDRYYYLMTFNLGENGYGVDPIYARYGAPVEIVTPTRAGYTFQHWELNGAEATVPATMPSENREYVADWKANDTAKVSVVFWGENPDDEGYSYVKTKQIEAKPGDTISWDSWCFTNCTKVAHTHNALCGYNCGMEEHIHDSNCYVLTCTTEEHTSHTDSCYNCGRQEHEHSNSCCKNGGTNITHWWHDDNCCTAGGAHTHSSSCGYNCTLHTHSIADKCYTVACGKDEHPHTADCGYTCGVAEEHVHTSTCGTDQSGLGSSLWTFVRSDTVTVNADGNTVVNVYYDRTTFTLTFIKNSNTVKTITDKWGADIHSEFPIKDGDKTMWWTVPSGTSSMKPGTEFGSLDTMPPENITFSYDSATQAATLHYYVEALPGQDGKTALEIYEGFTNTNYAGIDSSKKYTSYKDINVSTSGHLTYTEEFHNIIGFRQYVSNPKFDKHEQGGVTTGINTDNYLLYARNGFDIVFYNPTDLLKTQENVPYQMPLNSYNWTPTPDQAPEKYEPGSVKFAGWYLNPDCSGEQFDFATNTMPAGPNNANGETALALYAKWEPVEYTVNYYLTEESMNRGEDIPAEMTRRVNEAVAAGAVRPTTDPYTVVFAQDIIKHGAYIGKPGDPKVSEGYENIHPRAGYDFIGWFYRNEEGKEVAFDPENMPVDRNLNLYGKWSANVLCYYNVYFALDENGDGIADTDASGKIIYVADPINGSAIAGRTYTFAAKGGEELYDPEGEVNYREGYFPTVGSHSITIDIQDVDGTDTNTYTFLYKPKAAVPYTVKYIDKATGGELRTAKVVSDNKNVVVTENFVYIQGFLPDEYQKTLVVTDDGNTANDVIIFYYTKDDEHALYVVNYYIQQLDGNLGHVGWIQYTDLQYTGVIGQKYGADAIAIDGFTLSAAYTNGYNAEKINGMNSAALPAAVSQLTGNRLEGTLAAAGMELNFYYTRDLYPFEFRFMLNGTTIELAEPVVGKAGYDMVVTQGYKEIVMDLDGDGINEDYRLYDPTETVKEIHINKDGSPLASNAVVTEGQAKVNIATFYYVRCTQTMTVTKQVTDHCADSDPDPDQVFKFSLLIHAKDGYHQTSYNYKLSDGSAGTLSPMVTKPNTLEFTLKAGQTITIEGLPTAEYTLTELDLPTGYYDDAYAPAQRNKLTVDGQLDVVVTNVYEPARLEISKIVDVVEGDTNTPEIAEFEYTITVPEGVTGTYSYKLGDTVKTATVTDGKLIIALKNGETARFLNLPLGSYTVAEKDYSAYGYDSNYSVNGGNYMEGTAVTVAMTRKHLQTVDYLNKFPVGDLIIDKTVVKEFYATAWTGDTFTFTVERTTAGRPLIPGNSYKLFLDGVEQTAIATVDADGKLTVTITFTAADAEILKIEDSAVQHLLTVKNLPAGTYKVTERRADGYEQTPTGLTAEDLTIPTESTVASFQNEVLRKYGDLYLEKEMEVLDGYNPPVEVIQFQFIIELLEGVPTEDMHFTVVYTPDHYTKGNATPATVTMSGGKLIVALEVNQSVEIKNLPEGKYRITEATIPYYANDFAHKVDGEWVPQADQSTEAGQMFTQIHVPGDGKAEALCTNTYPVDKAELILQKRVTKEYDRDVLPDTEFLFTVTLAEPDMDSYKYKIYDADGGVVTEGTLAAADKRVFTVRLKAGQYAVIPGMPVCGYSVVETVSTADYKPGYAVYVSDTGDEISSTVNTETVSDSGSGAAVSRTFSAGKTDALVFTNEYKRHLGTLTIRKTVEGTDAKDTFLFHISGNGVEMDVTIDGSGSVTIHDLPLGTYTVTEDTAWNWRYTTDSAAAGATLTIENPHAEVSFKNTYQENQWLNFFANMFNVFGKKAND